jgi:hypothetical protein
MIFVETSLFSKLLPNYLGDDDYRCLQAYLLEHPESGDLIQGSGGLRKIRWAIQGKGKSGGVRIIYYWHRPRHHIHLLTLYGKSEQANIDKATLNKIAKALETL